MQRTLTAEFKCDGVNHLLNPSPKLLVQDSGFTAYFLKIYDFSLDALKGRQYFPKAVFVFC